MAAPVFIDVADAAEGADLARSLARRGLPAGLVRTGARWQVEVRSPREDARSFLADVGVALAAWSGGERHVPMGGTGRALLEPWVSAALADGGREYEHALSRLRAFLVAVSWFELERRRPEPTPASVDDAGLVRDSAEAACAFVLSRIGDYHGQSRFPVWAAKFAIHETAAAAPGRR